jgi:sortase A
MKRRIFAFVLIVACGLGLLLYPQAVRWFALRAQSQQTQGFVASLTSQGSSANDAILAAAHDYNTRLSHTNLGRIEQVNATKDADYEGQLRVPGQEIMAQVAAPEINVNLGVYHGTNAAALQHGAGHLYGSALPVGGESTHTVISAHSGLQTAELFSKLGDLKEGDTFDLTAAGQTIRYKVDQIAVVLPDDAEKVQMVPGKDYATLLTCTPIGINSHRLLVRGERVEMTAAQAAAAQADNISRGIPFPWWAVIWAGGVLLAWVFAKFTMKPAKKKKKKKGTPPASSTPPASEPPPAPLGRHALAT